MKSALGMSRLASEEYSSEVRRYLAQAVGATLQGFATIEAARQGAAQPRLEEENEFLWLRRSNETPDREERQAIAARTREVVRCRAYILEGSHTVPLKHISESVEGTRIVSPTVGAWPVQAGTVRASAPLEPLPSWAGQPTELSIENDVVFGVAAALCSAGGRRCAAVNAASGYHSGGGFSTGGRHALEEAMCVQSTLYESLQRAEQLARDVGICVPIWASPPRKQDGSLWQQQIPDDGVVLSPSVEIFRAGTDFGYRFEERATTLEAVISVAMPNCNSRMSDSPVDAHPEPAQYRLQLIQKWRATLAAAAYWTEADCLVVPDAGCGVFRNPPAEVGMTFGSVLRQEFMGRFGQVVIAVPGNAAGDEFAAAALVAFQGQALPPSLPPSASPPTPVSGEEGGFVWEFSVRRGFEPFSADCQAMVEAKYGVYQATGDPTPAKIPTGDKVIVIDFITMTQHIEGSSRIREVQRRETGSR